MKLTGMTPDRCIHPQDNQTSFMLPRHCILLLEHIYAQCAQHLNTDLAITMFEGRGRGAYGVFI